MNLSVDFPEQWSRGRTHKNTVSSWGKEPTKQTHHINYLCGDHEYLQNLQTQFPWNLVSGSVFFTRVHEVEPQVFPQTFFFHVRIEMSHCSAATEDQCLNT